MRQNEAGRQSACRDSERLLERKRRALPGEERASGAGQENGAGTVPDPADVEDPLDPIGSRRHRRRCSRPGQRLLADLAQRVAVSTLPLRRPGNLEKRGERGHRRQPGEPGVDRARSLVVRSAGGSTPEIVIGVVQNSSARAGFIDNRLERSLE